MVLSLHLVEFVTSVHDKALAVLMKICAIFSDIPVLFAAKWGQSALTVLRDIKAASRIPFDWRITHP